MASARPLRIRTGIPDKARVSRDVGIDRDFAHVEVMMGEGTWGWARIKVRWGYDDHEDGRTLRCLR